MADRSGQCCDNARILVQDTNAHKMSGPVTGVSGGGGSGCAGSGGGGSGCGGSGAAGPVVGGPVEEVKDVTAWRRQCGCIRTSEKLKHILTTFPSPPPPTPAPAFTFDKTCNYCIYPSGRIERTYMSMDKCDGMADKKCFHGANSRSWQLVGELVQLVQLSVTATALALYYLIYCYMQLVYYTLRSALYFHNADGPMKITIGVVTVTSLIVGFNLILRMEKIVGILY